MVEAKRKVRDGLGGENKVSTTQAPLEFTGHKHLRQVLTLSLLSGRQVIVKNIRSNHSNPGLLPYEVNLLGLIEKVTNGCQISINKTGTRLIFRPGIIDANDGVEVQHDCDLARSITYYLEVICLLGIFGKTELNVTLTGNTDDAKD